MFIDVLVNNDITVVIVDCMWFGHPCVAFYVDDTCVFGQLNSSWAFIM